MTTAAKGPSYLRLIGSYPFGLLWASQAVSELGSSFTRMALFLLAGRATLAGAMDAGNTVAAGAAGAGNAVAAGAASGLGLLMAVQLLPPLVLGPFGGPLVDRSARKALMVTVDIARAGLVAALAFAGSFRVALALVFAQSTLSVLFGPARSSIMPEIVARENLLAATSLWQATSQGLAMVGPALAGLAVGLWGLGSAFLIDAATFILSALALAALRLPALGRGLRKVTARSYLADLGQGLVYTACQPAVRFYVVGLTYMMLVGGLANVLAVVYALDVAGLTDQQYGLVSAANGVGAIAAAFLVGELAGKVGRDRVFLGAMALLGAALGLYALRPGFWGLAGLTVLDNGACVASLIAAQTSLYETVDRGLRGRTFTLLNAAMAAAPLPGYFLAGAVAGLAPPAAVLGLCGLFILLGSMTLGGCRVKALG